MVLIHCFIIVYRWICLKMFLINDNGNLLKKVCIGIEKVKSQSVWIGFYLKFWIVHLPEFWWFSVVKWKSSHYRKSYPKSYSVLYSGMNLCIVNWLESVNVTDVVYWPNGITSLIAQLLHNGITCCMFFHIKWLPICKPGDFVFTVLFLYFFFVINIYCRIWLIICFKFHLICCTWISAFPSRLIICVLITAIIVYKNRKLWNLWSDRHLHVMRGADKSLALPGRKQATATKLGIYSTYSTQSTIHF